MTAIPSCSSTPGGTWWTPRPTARASTVETRHRDITQLTVDDLEGTALVTASALLDLLTRDEVRQFALVCVSAACPALLTLSVAGRVELAAA